jgi:hypothetical protein
MLTLLLKYTIIVKQIKIKYGMLCQQWLHVENIKGVNYIHMNGGKKKYKVQPIKTESKMTNKKQILEAMIHKAVRKVLNETKWKAKAPNRTSMDDLYQQTASELTGIRPQALKTFCTDNNIDIVRLATDLGQKKLNPSDVVTAVVGYQSKKNSFKSNIINKYQKATSENKLMEFVDMGGRAKEKPISYSSIEKTFYSFFIYQDLLETPISFKLEEGNNPRSLEKVQIVQLMNIIAEEIYIGKFDLELGTSRLESKIQNDGEIPMEHMRAYRMGKEEIMYNWLKYLSQIVQSHFISLGQPVDEKKLFQYEFTDTLWNNIRNYINNLSALPLWTNNELSNTVFGGKQNYQFWHTIFTTGSSPQGVKVLVQPLNLNQLQIPRT